MLRFSLNFPSAVCASRSSAHHRVALLTLFTADTSSLNAPNGTQCLSPKLSGHRSDLSPSFSVWILSNYLKSSPDTTLWLTFHKCYINSHTLKVNSSWQSPIKSAPHFHSPLAAMRFLWYFLILNPLPLSFPLILHLHSFFLKVNCFLNALFLNASIGVTMVCRIRFSSAVYEGLQTTAKSFSVLRGPLVFL